MKFLTDNWIMAKRQYAHLLAQPDEIAGTLLFPILMVVLFAYVFGSAIKLPGGANYREFLMPGIFMQVTAMSAVKVRRNMRPPATAGVANEPSPSLETPSSLNCAVADTATTSPRRDTA